MTNLLTVLPHFDILPFTHLLPSLEKALVSTADLLTLEPLDVAKRAQVPPAEVKKLTDALLEALRAGISLTNGHVAGETTRLSSISTLDDSLDAALGGGVAPRYITEIVGESAAGKTQFLLTLLLSVQLPPSEGGLGKSALYISTEAPLQTSRLAQILQHHPKLSALPLDERPSLSRIQSTHIHDVEAQEHILRYQVPVAIQKQNIGLVVVDSIAANYRAEFDRTKARKGAESFAKRSHQLTQLGALLNDIAQRFGVAVVVANQVADRFTSYDQPPPSQAFLSTQATQRSRPHSPQQMPPASLSAPMSTNAPSTAPPATAAPILSTDDPLALDHQQRFFTGWGDDPTITNLKTPSLGLTWTNQLGARIALLKHPLYDDDRVYEAGEDRVIAGWRRTAKVIFAAWCAETQADFEIWQGGVRGVVLKDGGDVP